jgi:hypothetical protein
MRPEEISLATPALLFPALSLLMLSYTNRFLSLAALIRNLDGRYRDTRQRLLLSQIEALRVRVNLIRNMQSFGVASMLLAVISIFFLFEGWDVVGRIIFGLSLLAMIISLALCLREIQLSGNALDLLLSDLEDIDDEEHTGQML